MFVRVWQGHSGELDAAGMVLCQSEATDIQLSNKINNFELYELWNDTRLPI